MNDKTYAVKNTYQLPDMLVPVLYQGKTNFVSQEIVDKVREDLKTQFRIPTSTDITNYENKIVQLEDGIQTTTKLFGLAKGDEKDEYELEVIGLKKQKVETKNNLHFAIKKLDESKFIIKEALADYFFMDGSNPDLPETAEEIDDMIKKLQAQKATIK